MTNSRKFGINKENPNRSVIKPGVNKKMPAASISAPWEINSNGLVFPWCRIVKTLIACDFTKIAPRRAVEIMIINVSIIPIISFTLKKINISTIGKDKNTINHFILLNYIIPVFLVGQITIKFYV